MILDRMNCGRRTRAALGWVLCAAVGGAAAQTGASAVDTGRQLYMNNGCYTCHGTVGQGGSRGGGPRLAPAPHPFEAFKALVRQPREAMPRLDPHFVSDEQLQAMHGYLASIAKGPLAKDIPQLQTGAH